LNPPEFNNDKELFQYLLKSDNTPSISLKKIFEKYDFKYIDLNESVSELFSNDNFVLIDARSEKEFEEDPIPGAINFPVLNNSERHFTGLAYTKFSQTSAVKLAVDYAEPKIDSLFQFLNQNKASEKRIIVYCWRGGGRSKYLSKMITDLGFKPEIIIGGQKKYRAIAKEFFDSNPFPYKLLEISGMTGCGKTDLLNYIKKIHPVIDLEKSALHFSSLFGFVPYKIRGFKSVKNQSAFENRLFGEIMTESLRPDFKNLFLVESESRKIGDFFIPQNFYSAVENAPSIQITSSLENRIKRIRNAYFGDYEKGKEAMLEIFKVKERYFKKEMSTKLYYDAMNSLNSEDVNIFIEMLLLFFYDKKYKVKPKIPLLEISSDDIPKASDSIIDFLKENKL
jgi:tRNA 2-selenouridine synthase